MLVLDSLDQMLKFDDYRVFMRERLKRLSPEREPIFISKARLDFNLNGNTWKSYALIFGKKSRTMAMKMRKEGATFIEGVCYSDGKSLVIEGMSDKFVEGAQRTLKRLKLGFEAVSGKATDAEEEGADPAQLQRRAAKIQKAVQFWQKTELLATRELQKLQKTILELNDPRGKGVARELDKIRDRIETIDDEAREAADAAKKGDVEGFEKARDDFRQKAQRILERVSKDELIRMADSNPAVQTNIGPTLTDSLNRLLKAV